MSMLRVGQVAADYGVTVRTLHHYDEIDLLHPSDRTHSGYRLYTEADLERLRQIVAYRRLGFSLEDVAAVLRSDVGALGQLRRQRAAVSQRMDELSSLAHALDRAMEAEVNGYQITKEEQREIFGAVFSDEHYAKAQWQQIKAETDEINSAFSALLTAGSSATADEAVAVAERARLQIDRWFYDCSPQMHANIAQMYVDDPRFKATYEGHTAGLAQFVHDAVAENARRA